MVMRTYTCYTIASGNSSRIAPHFARGSGIPVVELPNDESIELADGGFVSYGENAGLRPMLDRVIAERREWIYIDNGYFKPGHFYGYYRVTRNAYMHDGRGKFSTFRWRALGIKIKPWRERGSFVLVCPPGRKTAELRGWDADAWLSNTITELKRHTRRDIVIREKPGRTGRRRLPLARAVKGAWALVTARSNAAVEAIIEGVPTFCTEECAASAMSLFDLSKIESPYMPTLAEREQWAANLAANQWTIEEMRSGKCWRELMRDVA